VLIVLESPKSSILPNWNFRKFFSWWGNCVFKTGIPGGPQALLLINRNFAITMFEVLGEEIRYVNVMLLW